MRLIKCDDGSYTYFHEGIHESYHSRIGAVTESFEKFVKPAEIEKRKGKIRILDVCYGMGFTSAAALDVATCSVDIVGLEKDPWIIRQTQHIYFPFKHKRLFVELAKQSGKKRSVTEKNNSITLHIGDARRTITRLEGSFDIVFFDPFSPKKAPHMWSQRFITHVASRCTKGGLFLTYSCAKVVRERLLKAGFTLRDGPAVGRRGPSTIATKQ